MSLVITLKTSVASIVAAAATLPALVLIAAPAQAAEPWVTRAEYRAATIGMAKGRIHRIFDVSGVLVLAAGPGHPYQSRHYRMKVDGRQRCDAIDYDRRNGVWRMAGKSRPFRPYGDWKCRLRARVTCAFGGSQLTGHPPAGCPCRGRR